MRVPLIKRLMRAAIAAAVLAGFGAAPAQAEPLPRLDQIGAPEPVLREISDLMVSLEQPNAVRIQRLDALLAQIREPSQVRGFVQFLRAVNLNAGARTSEARIAADEAIRLLPGFSAPLLLASYLETYADRPGIGADHLLRASEIDPAIVRQIPPYELDNILSRLSGHHDVRRLGRLAERMIEINWEGADVDLRSQLGLQAIRARVAAGNVEGARALVPQLVSPQHTRSLLIDNRYRALWSDLETWGGSRQERQWPLYLSELKARFEASGDLEAAQRYAGGLRLAGHHRTVVHALAPLFARPLDRERDYDLLWVAPALADSLARLGRWDEIDPLFARAMQTWPLGSEANALNLAGNRARYRLFAGDAAGALRDLEAVLADAQRRTGEVTRGALAAMHIPRACALNSLGRGHEAVESVAAVSSAGDPAYAASLHLCFDRLDAARAALIEGLENESSREDVLAWVQPADVVPMQSDYGRRNAARGAVLRRDPALLAAVARYGRILPHPPSAGAPPEAPAVTP